MLLEWEWIIKIVNVRYMGTKEKLMNGVSRYIYTRGPWSITVDGVYLSGSVAGAAYLAAVWFPFV